MHGKIYHLGDGELHWLWSEQWSNRWELVYLWNKELFHEAGLEGTFGTLRATTISRSETRRVYALGTGIFVSSWGQQVGVKPSDGRPGLSPEKLIQCLGQTVRLEWVSGKFSP